MPRADSCAFSALPRLKPLETHTCAGSFAAGIDRIFCVAASRRPIHAACRLQAHAYPPGRNARLIVKIGSNNEMTNPPMTAPSTVMMIGSSMAVAAFTATASSASL